VYHIPSDQKKGEKTMSFGKAIQNTNATALGEFSLASIEFRAACKRFTNIRLMMDRPDASDAELATYDRARRVYKVACKVYNAARGKYISAIRQVTIEAPNPTNEELYLLASETNRQSLAEAAKTALIADSITKEEWEEAEKFKREREERASAKREFLANSEDPTFGDFEPLGDS
jgi:hypothetical protein